MKIKKIGIIIIFLSMINTNSFSQFVMPEETIEHEGTWLQWPHHYTYGMFYRNSLDDTWVEMTSALVSSEKVHIIAYNTTERDRIITLLNNASVPMTNIDFYIHENDDVWVRDNGPMFVYDTNNNLTILDWGFNGWGNDAPYSKCDVIPTSISNDLTLPVVDLSVMVLEGGAIEHDGNGTMMATRSSITHSSRNPELTESQIEDYLSTNMGISNFIWLNGVYGSEITDMHIDGFVKFANDSTIVTFNNSDLQYWGLSLQDIDTLLNAKNINGVAYNFVIVPLTQNNVTTAYGNQLDYKGSYCNYYIANSIVLVPNYNDPNDAVANSIIQGLYPSRTVIGIDVRNLYENGGMIHCVTQQQPINQNTSSINTIEKSGIKIGEIYPNPTNAFSTIKIILQEESSVEIIIFDIQGKKIVSKDEILPVGKSEIEINTSGFKNGIYTYLIKVNDEKIKSDKLIMK
jgi:agmatine deiminase